jgi:hypothetical protein
MGEHKPAQVSESGHGDHRAETRKQSLELEEGMRQNCQQISEM